MKRISLSSVFKSFLLICVLGFIMRKANSCSNSNTMSSAEFRQEMIELAKEMDDPCPMNMDGVGTISSVVLNDNIFECTIHIVDNFFEHVDVDELKFNIIKNMREGTSFSEYANFASLFEKYGYSYKYLFYDSEGELIEDMGITGKDLLEQL